MIILILPPDVTMAPAATAVAEVLQSRKGCIDQGWASGSGGWCAHHLIAPEPGGAGSLGNVATVPGLSVGVGAMAGRRHEGGFIEAQRTVLGPDEMKLVAGSR